jgi:homocysteine S-methyltransferase
MSAPTLRERVEDGRIHVVDGAMGTLLYARGVFVNVCYDALALERPDLVRGIHAEYVAAGAELLETNTFGANPVKLSSYGLDDETEALNRAAAVLAREASEGHPDVHVLGAVGPLGIRIEPWGPTSQDEAEAYYRRQVSGLLEGGWTASASRRSETSTSSKPRSGRCDPSPTSPSWPR